MAPGWRVQCAGSPAPRPSTAAAAVPGTRPCPTPSPRRRHHERPRAHLCHLGHQAAGRPGDGLLVRRGGRGGGSGEAAAVPHACPASTAPLLLPAGWRRWLPHTCSGARRASRQAVPACSNCSTCSERLPRPLLWLLPASHQHDAPAAARCRSICAPSRAAPSRGTRPPARRAPTSSRPRPRPSTRTVRGAGLWGWAGEGRRRGAGRIGAGHGAAGRGSAGCNFCGRAAGF